MRGLEMIDPSLALLFVDCNVTRQYLTGTRMLVWLVAHDNVESGDQGIFDVSISDISRWKEDPPDTGLDAA